MNRYVYNHNKIKSNDYLFMWIKLDNQEPFYETDLVIILNQLKLCLSEQDILNIIFNNTYSIKKNSKTDFLLTSLKKHEFIKIIKSFKYLNFSLNDIIDILKISSSKKELIQKRDELFILQNNLLFLDNKSMIGDIKDIQKVIMDELYKVDNKGYLKLHRVTNSKIEKISKTLKNSYNIEITNIRIKKIIKMIFNCSESKNQLIVTSLKKKI